MAIENVAEVADFELKDDEQWVCINVNKVTTRSGESVRVDIREYIATDNYEGYTKKGISIPASIVDDFVKALTTAKGIAEKEQEKAAAPTPTKKKAPSKKATAKKAGARN